MIALTRPVPSSINRCELTHLAREPIDFARATEQHDAYERALVSMGCRIQRLPALDDMPDSVFVEDTAVVLPEVAIITRPGAASRRGEVASVAEALQTHRPLVRIGERPSRPQSPGVSPGDHRSRARRPTAAGGTPALLDGGDVLTIGKRIFVGRSARTNDDGIEQLRRIAEPYGYRVIAVEIRDCLHLKSAVTSIGDAVLINSRWVDPGLFDARVIEVVEPQGANALFVNGAVLYPSEFPHTRDRIEKSGFSVITVEAGELAKAEGGVTCCSIIYKQ